MIDQTRIHGDAIKASDSRWDALIAAFPDFIVQIDEHARYLAVNRVAPGLTLEQVIGRRVTDFLEPTFHGPALSAIAHAFRTGEVTTYEVRRAGPPGQLRDYETRVCPCVAADGRRTAILIATDVTERYAIESELDSYRGQLEQRVRERTQALADSEARLREAQRIAHLGDWILDATTGALDWSDEVFAIHGRTRLTYTPAISSYYADIVHPDDVDRVRDEEQAAYASGRRHQVDYRIRRQDGTERWVHVEGIFSTGEGARRQLRGTVQDITDRKLMELEVLRSRDAAESANLAKGHFLSKMSHELLTPMNAIMGFGRMLEDALTDAEHRDHASDIVNAGDHLLLMIKDLLDFSRVEIGQMKLLIEPMVLGHLIEDVERLMAPILNGRGQTLLRAGDVSLPILADRTRLKQVLINLISNASKYGPADSEISFTVTTSNNRVRMAIADSGPGVPEHRRDELFQPFSRLGAEGTGVDGIGIGLALCKQLVELMNGRIGVETGEGQGAQFWVDLPRVVEAVVANEPARTALTREPGGLRKVLYIEDDSSSLRLLEAFFRNIDWLVLLKAKNGRQGIDLARDQRPDLILLDIRLPGMDGYAVLSELQSDERTSAIPVIALTAEAGAVNTGRGLSAGFSDYHTKPVCMNDLLQSVRTHIGIN